jgi:hypothetical protein
MAGEHAVTFGSLEREFVRLRLGKAYDDDEPYRGVDTRIDLKVGGFSADAKACLFTGELRGLRDELKRLHRSLSGTIEFRTLEGQVEFDATLTETGHLNMRGHLQDVAGIGNRLEFYLDLDQTFLPPAISALDAFLGDLG